MEYHQRRKEFYDSRGGVGCLKTFKKKRRGQEENVD